MPRPALCPLFVSDATGWALPPPLPLPPHPAQKLSVQCISYEYLLTFTLLLLHGDAVSPFSPSSLPLSVFSPRHSCLCLQVNAVFPSRDARRNTGRKGKRRGNRGSSIEAGNGCNVPNMHGVKCSLCTLLAPFLRSLPMQSGAAAKCTDWREEREKGGNSTFESPVIMACTFFFFFRCGVTS